jgi:hypothetical protein
MVKIGCTLGATCFSRARVPREWVNVNCDSTTANRDRVIANRDSTTDDRVSTLAACVVKYRCGLRTCLCASTCRSRNYCLWSVTQDLVVLPL